MSFIYETLSKLSNQLSLFVLLTSAQVLISLLTVCCNVIILFLQKLTSHDKIPHGFAKLSSTTDQHLLRDKEHYDMGDGCSILGQIVSGVLNCLCYNDHTRVRSVNDLSMKIRQCYCRSPRLNALVSGGNLNC
ncbi:uncharacterized protein LOC124260145 [Haliotis rubra]|uniref:uncharacterized protein LOC124260145 n=1 Tax=Haliotis rubra TaxID=36100 RepID=UPI001EE5EB30|nr:uncharacterized protein LOC124260145 [Haliotis rubra]